MPDDVACPRYEPRCTLDRVASFRDGGAPRFILHEVLFLQERTQLSRALTDTRRSIAGALQQVNGALMVLVGGVLTEQRDTDGIVGRYRGMDRREHHGVVISSLSCSKGGSQELFRLL